MNEYGYSELPATRFSHTINMITENEFIMYGGIKGNVISSKMVNEVWSYNLITNQWL
jgi:hypothetical protein